MKAKNRALNYAKKLLEPRMWIFYLILIFIYYKFSYFTFRYHFPVWDEAVYISMSKFFYSLGSSGYLETLRPIFLPLLFGAFWKLAPHSYMLVYELIELAFACGTIYLTYIISRDVWHKYVGIIAAALLAITPVFFKYSSFILTAIPSTFFVLLSIYCIYKKKWYELAGFFAGLAFLTRFPQALFCGAVLIYLVIRFVTSKQWNARKLVIVHALKFGVMAFITTVPFFLFNLIYYQKDTSSWFHAMFRPLIFASNLIKGTYLWLYDSYFGFFFIEAFKDNPLLIFSVVGLFVFFILKKRHERSKKNYVFADYLLLSVLIIFIIYFSTLNRKEYRYVLSFLPYLCMFAAVGIWSVGYSLYTNGKTYGKMLLVFFILFVAHVSYDMALVSADTVRYRSFDKPPIVAENYEFLRDRPLVGAIVTTDPLLGVYVDNKIIPAYYSLQDLEYALKTYDYSAIYMVPRAYPCQESDHTCIARKTTVMGEILLDNHLVLDKTYNDIEYYIFTKENYYTRLSKSALFQEYGLTQDLKLSRFPRDKFPVVLILEDFPSLDDTKENIWEEDNYQWIKQFFSDKVAPSFAVVPTHLTGLQTVAPDEVTYLREQVVSGAEIIQNGNEHANELKRSRDEQRTAVLAGREAIHTVLDASASSFIPPYYVSNSDTISVLSDLGYQTYISNVGDYTNASPLRRFDQPLTPIENWNEKSFKSIENIEKELHYIRSFNEYLVVSLYYYMYTNDTREHLGGFYNLIKDDALMSSQQLTSWRELIEDVQFTMDGNEISLRGNGAHKDASKITLLAFGSGTYYLESDMMQFQLKNAIDAPIEVCFNDVCHALDAGEMKQIEV